MDTISMNNLQHACPCLHLVVLLQPLVNIWLKTFLSVSTPVSIICGQFILSIFCSREEGSCRLSEETNRTWKLSRELYEV